MKKRVISLFMSALLVFSGMANIFRTSCAVSAEVDILGLAETAGKFYNGISKTVKTLKEEDPDAGCGEAFVLTLKNLGKELAGIEDEKEGTESPNWDEALKEVDTSLDAINTSITALTDTLNDQGKTLQLMYDDMNSNYNSLSKTLKDISQAMATNAEMQKAYAYITDFLKYYNNFKNAIAYYEDQKVGASSAAGIKSTNDKFFTFNGYGADSMYASLEAISQYLQGTRYTLNTFTMEKGSYSIVNVLCEYLKLAGYSQKQIAQTLEAFVTEIYYTYMLGTYYYTYLSTYQVSYIRENGGPYVISETDKRDEQQILKSAENALNYALNATGVIFSDMQLRFVDYSYYTVTYSVRDNDYFTDRIVRDNQLQAEPGSTIYLPDAGEMLGNAFSKTIAGMADIEYKYVISGSAASEGNKITVNEDAADGSTVTAKLVMSFPNGTSKTVNTVTLKVKKSGLPNGFGYGTEELPYMIFSAADYNAFAAACNAKSGSEKVYAYQLSNMDFNNGTVTPINNFYGEYHGNGYTFKNAKITGNASNGNLGLIRKLYGSFDYVAFENVHVLMSENKDATSVNVGIVAGAGYGGTISGCTFKNCSSKTEWSGGNMKSGEKNIGGICGIITKTGISDCMFMNSAVYTTDNGLNAVKLHVGGIIGKGDGVDNYYYENNFVCFSGVVNCNISAASANDKYDAVGGIAGEIRRTCLGYNFIYMLQDQAALSPSTSGAWGIVTAHFYDTGSAGVYYNYIYTGDGAMNSLKTGKSCSSYIREDGVYFDYVDQLGDIAYKKVTSLKLSNLADNLGGSYVDGTSYPELAPYTETVNTANVSLSPTYGSNFVPKGFTVTVKMGTREIGTYKLFRLYKIKLFYGMFDSSVIRVPDTLVLDASGKIEAGATLFNSADSQTFELNVDNTKHDHHYTVTSSTPADCTTTGEANYKCQCGVTYKQTLKAKGHTYVGNVCSVCKEVKDGKTVSGTVTSYGTSGEVTLTLYASDGTSVVAQATVSGNSARYTLIGVAAGTYTLKASKADHAANEYTVTVGSDDVVQNVSLLLYGDMDSSGIVDTDDAIYLLKAVFDSVNFPIAAGQNPDCDGDKSINTDDAIYLLKHVFDKENFPLAK